MSSSITQPRYTCALGAQQTVLAIPGAHPIIHAGPGCSSKITSFLANGAGFQGEGYAGGGNVSSTNTYEKEVVFGGENKLRSTVEGAMRVLDGELFVVLTGCTADIVGDDSLSVANEFAEEGYPVVGVETAGFKGNNYYGHNVVINAIIEQFVGEVKPQVRRGTVNLLGIVPYQNPYWRADIETLKSLLESVGLTVNSLFGYASGGVSEWKDIPNAQFNLVVSPWVGLDTAKLLEEKYGTPFMHYPVLPVGASETSKFLRSVGEFAGIDKGITEPFVKCQEDRFYKYLTAFIDFLTEFRNNLPCEFYAVADATYATAFAGFLVNEIGYIPKGVYIVDNTPEQYKTAVIDTLNDLDPRLGGLTLFETDGITIQNDIRKKLGTSRKALFLGSGWEKFLAQETNNLYAFVSLPLPETVVLNRTYTGYNGGLNLLEEIYSNKFKSGVTTSRTQMVIEK
jgi:nitrogenase molybdenum-iron protein beta chain